jgi:hypothetical protein
MTIRLRTLAHPDGTWAYVVDRVPISEQTEFAYAFNRFCDNAREKNPNCIGGLVFHDPVVLPDDVEIPVPPDMVPQPIDPVGEFGQRVTPVKRAAVLRPHCPVCDRQIEVYRTDMEEWEQTLYSHGDGEGGRCDGSKGAPVYRRVSDG